MSLRRTSKRPPPQHLQPRPVEERVSGLAKASLANKGKTRLTADRNMPFGKHVGLKVDQVCKLFPAYMHYLIRDGAVLATREICDLIQEGYNAEAKRLNAEFGSAKFNYTPYQPQLAPDPID